MSDNLHVDTKNIASNSSRLMSYLVDEVIVSFVFAVAYWDQLSALGTPQQFANFINNLIIEVLFLKISYQSFFVWFYGSTLGKMLFKIRVISINTFEKPNFFEAFLRANLRIISEWFFSLGFIWAYFNPLKQTFHGKIAKTLVVNA